MLVLPLPLHLACSVCDPAGLPAYSSMAAALPASIKVHTAHSNDGSAVIDQEAVLQGSSISVALPQLQAGVLHPAMVIKYWRQRGLAEDFGVLFGFAVKAYVRQVPFRWFCPLLAADVLINIAGCLKHGMLLHWLLPRYCAALLLPLALAAAQQVQGRRQFCARHGIEVQPGCRWLPGM
ncbi:hypothetical protein OEZ85_005760 [Tetradesmus obliquus]|uniref:Uncharacterized protein n=1 Tax=Tetradesmus obliquus TaxID=3088 RepID=A0ABY8UF12_TETOB|nr:hypothetical protein OEZ85_005760 [Tetradesmus obliquus]